MTIPFKLQIIPDFCLCICWNIDGMEVDPKSAVAGQFDDADVDHW